MEEKTRTRGLIRKVLRREDFLEKVLTDIVRDWMMNIQGISRLISRGNSLNLKF